jgi:ribosomal protein S18 acetylase RimI-like enzyme
MTLYARYLKEREGIETLESEHGFATYLLRPTDCYIIDIYVVPELRQSGLAKQLADQIVEIAKERGIKLLTGSVDRRDPNAQRNEAVLLAYGMRKAREDNFMNYYLKEIT